MRQRGAKWRATADDETSTVELKKAVPRPGELTEQMCEMANAQGAPIFIGVEDTNLMVVGMPDGGTFEYIVLCLL